MKRLITAVVLTALCVSVAPAWAQDTAPVLTVVAIPISGDIEPSTAVFVKRRAEAAMADGAGALVFTIDTFGGRVDSALRIASFIGSLKNVRTVAYVGGGQEGMGVSWSAGALIALACSEIYMAPGTSIGAAAPVTASADGQMEAAGEKTVSAVRAQMAALAEKNGHPVGIALAMVDADVELVELDVDGRTLAVTADEALALQAGNPDGVSVIRTIDAAGKLLSLTAGDAERYGLSSGTIDGLEALALALGFPGGMAVLEPSLSDSVVTFLTSQAVQAILILIGLVALFVEINSPGFGVPGTIAIIAFIMLFGSNMLVGTVGSLELVLFILGLALLAVEIFLLPGFGVAGVGGLVLIGAALVLSMQDFILPQSDWQWDVFARNAATVGAGLLLAILGIGLLIAFGPKLRLFDRLTLKTAITATATGRPALDMDHDDDGDQGLPDMPVPGVRGTALTVLRPVGRAEFGGTVFVVETEGIFVDAGATVEVAALRNGQVVVRPVQAS